MVFKLEASGFKWAHLPAPGSEGAPQGGAGAGTRRPQRPLPAAL